MGIVFTIIGLVILWKVTWFFIKMLGKLIGAAFSLFGYLLLGVLSVAGFGLAVIAVPVILIIGVVTVISALGK